MPLMHILITGGAGFIGSTLIKYILNNTDNRVVNLDKLTYAGNLDALRSITGNERYSFERVDICDAKEVERVFASYPVDVVMNLAAESHVDRSIDAPAAFVETNVVGTYTLLQVARCYWESLPEGKDFCFHHISTDEVYGDLEKNEAAFTEENAYKPNSPYSASKGASDHFVRAWHRTYGLPVIITNTSNNYGPWQFPEKLIPNIIINALQGQALPVYGDGMNMRDWLYVEDHAKALYDVICKGQVGRTYNIGGGNELTNLQVVEMICDILDEVRPGKRFYKEFIEFVTDRPGHDRRYAIDNTRISKEIGWKPSRDFERGLRDTINWYLNNQDWWEGVLEGKHPERMGTGR